MYTQTVMENERRQKMKIHSIKIASKNKSKNLIIFEAVSNREFIHIILNTHACPSTTKNMRRKDGRMAHGVVLFEFYKIFYLIRVSSRFAVLWTHDRFFDCYYYFLPFHRNALFSSAALVGRPVARKASISLIFLNVVPLILSPTQNWKEAFSLHVFHVAIYTVGVSTNCDMECTFQR